MTIWTSIPLIMAMAAIAATGSPLKPVTELKSSATGAFEFDIASRAGEATATKASIA